MGSKDWQRPWLKQLRGWANKRFPLQFPMRCYVRPARTMRGARGYFRGYRDNDNRLIGGMILISDRCKSEEELRDIFVEEWSHARVAPLLNRKFDLDGNDPDFPGASHDMIFWAQYGKIMMAVRERVWPPL